MFETIFCRYDKIIFFDTETTGFDPDKDDQIIELAAYALSKDGASEQMDRFVKLGTKPELPEQITELTGITALNLQTEGVEESKALEEFYQITGNGEKVLLVAHNAQFDMMFLAYATLRHIKEHPEWLTAMNAADYLDTLTVYRDRHTYPHKLESAIEHYNLATKVKNSHRAIDDAQALMEVAKAMDEERCDLADYINIFGFIVKYGISGRKLKKVTYLEQNFNNFSGLTLPEQLQRKSLA